MNTGSTPPGGDDAHRIPLRAGPWSLVFEAGDLRALTVGGREVFSRVYAAVRDEAWRTVPALLRDVVVDRRSDGFRITYIADYRSGIVDVEARIACSGNPDGRITMDMAWAARSDFRRNRIGLCTHHHHGFAGEWARIRHVDGTCTPTSFPDRIAPRQLFHDVAAITVAPRPGLEATVSFQGDIFETEDQRNWGDASFKTYGTPLAAPVPVAVPAGTRSSQQLEIVAADRTPASRDANPGPGTVAPRPPDAHRCLIAADLGPGRPTPAVIRALGTCQLDRLRLELPLDGPCLERLAGARRVAEDLGLPVDVILTGEPGQAPSDLVRSLRDLGPASLVAYAGGVRSTPGPWVDRLRAWFPGVPVGGGNGMQFTELNRDPPDAQGWEVIAVPLDPYVHARDASSLLENVPAIGAITRSMEALAPGAAIHIALALGRHAREPSLVARHGGPLGARWLAEVLGTASAVGVAVLGCGPAWGPCGLVADDGAATATAGMLAERSKRTQGGGGPQLPPA